MDPFARFATGRVDDPAAAGMPALDVFWTGFESVEDSLVVGIELPPNLRIGFGKSASDIASNSIVVTPKAQSLQ